MTKPDKQSQGGTADGSKSQRKSASKIPSAEEIAAKRAVRAAKKAEEEQKAKLKEEELRAAALGLREDDGGEALSKNEKGERLFVPRRWRDVSSAPRENDQAGPSRNERRVRVLSWKYVPSTSQACSLSAPVQLHLHTALLLVPTLVAAC